MNPNAKKWIEALKSGQYKQVVGALGGPGGYCCLGVACALYEQETGTVLPKINRDNSTVYGSGQTPTGHLVKEFVAVKDWIGLGDSEGAPMFNKPLKKLVELNDKDMLDFNQIAAVLEQHEEDYFIQDRSYE